MTGPAAFDAVTTPIGTGTLLLEASAGTGKTFAITRLVVRLLLEGRARGIDGILVVTFTKAATEELALRIRRALHMALSALRGATDGVDPDLVTICSGRDAAACERVEAALRDFDRAQILTLHAFCKNVLEECAFESGMPFGVELLTDLDEIVQSVAFDHWRHRIHGDEDPELVELAAADGWGPLDFVREWKRVRARPEHRLEPVPLTLQAARAGWSEALDAVCAHVTPEFLAALVAAGGIKPLQELGGAALHADRLRDLVAGERRLGIETVLLFGRRGPEHWLGTAKKNKELLEHPFFAAAAGAARAAAQLRHALRAETFAALTSGCGRALRRAGALGFDDLLLDLHAALEGPAGTALIERVRARYSVALIDEFQDTDPVQFAILRALFADRTLLLIGDPKQSIYEFRGADVFAYLKARGQADASFGLGKNWRSHPRLVETLNHVFGTHPQPFVLSGLDFAPVAPEQDAAQLDLPDARAELCVLWMPRHAQKRDPAKLQFWSKTDGRMRIAAECATECARLLAEVPDMEPGKIAILVRKHSEAGPIQRALARAGIPSVLSRASDVFASAEARELELILRAVAAPQRRERLAAALATRALGWRLDALRALQDDETRGLALMQTFQDRLEDQRERGVFYALEKLFEGFDVRARLLQLEDGERALTNLLHLLELAHGAEQELELTPDGLVEWFARQRTELERSDEARELRLDRDEDAVQILTMHTSKGLEFDVVFCPSLWDGRAEEKGAVLVHEDDGLVYDFGDDELVYDFGDDELESEGSALRRQRAFAERLAEDLRLAYVALTRAKRRCYVVWGAIGHQKQHGGAHLSPLSWLLHARGVPRAAGESLEAWVLRAMQTAEEGVHQWEAELEELWRAGPADVEMRTLRFEEDPLDRFWTQPLAEARPLQARTVTLAPGQLDTWRITSFSALVSQSAAAMAEAPDHGEPEADGAEEGPARGLFAFARGARPGNVLHAVLEHADLQDPGAEANLALIRQCLTESGLDRVSAHRGELDPSACVHELLRTLARTRIAALGFSLGELAPERRHPEWQFWLPLRQGAPRRIAALWREHATDELQLRYARRLERLTDQELRGHITGYVDLLFEHEGCWHVLDWKSNWLGNSAASYRPERLVFVMAEHDYLLQSMLYQLAVARHLRTRDPSFDLDAGLGGGTYVFLRGVGDDGESGFFHERASLALLRALDDALLGPVRV